MHRISSSNGRASTNHLLKLGGQSYVHSGGEPDSHHKTSKEHAKLLSLPKVTCDTFCFPSNTEEK